jgi:hypothetical protein
MLYEAFRLVQHIMSALPTLLAGKRIYCFSKNQN